ncbi:flavin-containing monooxygenase [Sphingomonas crocodyli]|uniref:NAD(P)/FAD-dependent oxidoreductase n=1 Tax=Sphingomonas crocodyli TaxID=1979270 RepID=A0A437LVP0_9SPHN|nr:NAD(P)/FAD-dependent oxidoreductase [Sphingomonas crocodyli]RVT89449.1 NAD(P)/FAD-dependent oxidoreductase [Sphingomonas crocodyli]
MTEQAAANAFSPDALKEKYRIEREKRLRSDGNAQYLEISGVYRDFDADPYVEPGFTRDAVAEELDVVIIGGGFGGLLAGVRLAQQGVSNVRVIEKGGDFGGTWYWNRYPGAACDVESYIYLPMLEEMGYVPTEKYAKAPEIFAYCQSLARKFDLYDGALFQTLVTGADWDEATARWQVSTNRGDKLSARFLIVAGGLLHKAKLPGIPGIESFKGHSFHTSRWDYDYTGGSPTEPMVKLADKRVGIIGTGATAVQAIPKLAEAAGHLYVFQRTPSNVGVRGNRPTDPEWAKSLQPGWQQQRIENFTSIVTGTPVKEDLIKDGWTEILGGDVPLAATNTDEERRQIADFAKMEAIRARIDSTVKDRATAEALKPWYNAMCKRPCFHDEYLPAFNRPNVTLVDTDGHGVQRITETGVVVGDKEYEVDCLIYASGFEVTTGYTRRLGFEMHGKGGEAITDSWKEGAHTLHGIFTRGFPNLVMFSIIQGGQGINFLHGINELSIHVGEIVSGLLKDGARTVEPTEAAEQAWMGVIFSFLMATAKFNLECTPSYTNNEGSMGDMATARSAPYMGKTMDYIDILRAWRAEGSLEGLEITK